MKNLKWFNDAAVFALISSLFYMAAYLASSVNPAQVSFSKKTGLESFSSVADRAREALLNK